MECVGGRLSCRSRLFLLTVAVGHVEHSFVIGTVIGPLPGPKAKRTNIQGGHDELVSVMRE